MPRNGSGQFSRVHDWSEDAANDIDILADRMDEDADDMAQAIGDSLAANGEKVPTAHLPMGGFRHTGVGNATARDQYAAVGQAQDSAFQHGTVGGTADAITLTLSPAITAYAAGQRFSFVAGGSNTGAATVAVSGLAAKAIQKRGAALVAGDIKSGHLVEIVYDGAQFQMVSPALGGWELIGSVSASNSAAVDFEQSAIGDGTYKALMLVMSNVDPATAGGAHPHIRVKKGGSFLAGSGYAYHSGGNSGSAGAYTANVSAGGAQFLLGSLAQGANADSPQAKLSGSFFLWHPSLAAPSQGTWHISHGNTSGVPVLSVGSGLQNTAQTVEGLRFLYSSGNVASGDFHLFGLRAS